ncbi:MAG: hypothetical protein ACTSR3_05860 [Candidatus Helarchaeota archaeon]
MENKKRCKKCGKVRAFLNKDGICIFCESEERDYRRGRLIKSKNGSIQSTFADNAWMSSNRNI